MKNFKIIALIAILCHQSLSLTREKRSFSWPSFFGGGASTDVEVETEVEPADVTNLQAASDLPIQHPNFQIASQQQVEVPIQHLSSGYHYPIWRVHKYNGIELKPMPISLVRQQHLQQLHTRVPYTTRLQQTLQFNQLQQNQVHGQQFQSVAVQRPNLQLNGGQQFVNCKSKPASASIPPELQELAQQFGIKDASKLPSLEDAMGLLGTTTRADTIETIKELAATPDGMNLIRQFLASDDGAEISGDATASIQCDEVSPTQQPSDNNVPQTASLLPNFHQVSSIPIQQQEFVVPNPSHPQQLDVYGLPNQRTYQPQSHIMSLIKNQAVSPEQQAVPNELATALSEHQGYNTPKSNIEDSQQGHEIYGLPNIKPASFHQAYYAPRSNHIVESPKSEVAQTEGYNLPNADVSHETQETQQHETYGLPNVQEPVDFHRQGNYPPKTDNLDPQKEYGVPNAQEPDASGQHETYDLPNVEEPVNFLQQGPYPSKTDSAESANSGDTIAPHQEYNVPRLENNQQTQGLPSDFQQELPTTNNNQRFIQSQQPFLIPKQGISVLTPSHQTYEVANNDNANFQQDQQAPHSEYAVPSVADTQSSNTVQNPHDSYALPHQRFFESPNVFRQTQYRPRTKYNSNNQYTRVPILRQIDGTLDRTNTNLEFGQLFTTTLRPEAGFLERVGAWTKYFAPPGPTIPISPPQVTEDVNETPDHSPQTAFTIPIPKIPELNEPHLLDLPKTPQLPNVHIPTKFVLPPTANQGPFVRVELPLTGVSSLTQLPQQQPLPFDGQTVEEFVPDISQLPLEKHNLGSDLRTSYGLPAYQHSYADEDSSPAASETNVAVVLPGPSAKHLPNIEVDEIVENDVVPDDDDDEPPQKKNVPQRISSYDSYATGKLNRANDDAIIQLIPTQKPYTNQARTMGQVEDSSIIDAIATMTSGFRPIT